CVGAVAVAVGVHVTSIGDCVRLHALGYPYAPAALQRKDRYPRCFSPELPGGQSICHAQVLSPVTILGIAP
ncbi:MAG TPA: hypothetical protein VK701_07400, partial [Solirubrobacteraceae bacterium]|nr:hypothetical protein [Solirubrobacteraceae bacterium]